MSEEVTPTTGATQNKNPYLVPGAIIIAGLLIAFSVFSTQGKTETRVAGTTEITGSGVEITENDHIFGPKDPDVYFIEYSDYRCGYCGLFHETIQEVLKEFEGKVAWVYRHTPYQPGGKEAAVASECIAELVGEDAFWEFTDKVFKNQKELSPEWSKKTALELGAKEGEYDECISSGKFDELFASNTLDAQELGGNGTPYNVLVTREGGVVKFSGAQPLESVKMFINRALKSLE